jgi:hypothetical protein
MKNSTINGRQQSMIKPYRGGDDITTMLEAPRG